MKKLFLALTLCFISPGSWAQCNGVFPGNTYCGTNTATPAPPKAVAGSTTAITPEQFGAVGDGATDDTAAVQKAVNALLGSQLPKQTLFLANSYKLSSTVSLNASAIPSPIGFFSIMGQGKDFTFVTSGFSALEITGDDTNTVTDVTIANISCQDKTVNPTNAGSCIWMNGPSNSAATFDKIRFDNILSFNAHDAIKIGGAMSHSLFSNITTWNNFNGITFVNTTGTANVLTGLMTTVTSGAGLFAGDKIGNVGDLSVSNWQGDGGGVGLQLNAGPAYGDNVHIDGFQWNAGTAAVSLSGMNNVHINGNWDGITGFTVDTSTHNLMTDFSTTLSLDSLATSQNNYQPTVSSAGVHQGRYLYFTSSVSPIAISGMTDVWDGKVVDVQNNGNNVIRFTNNSSLSTAANRFQLGADVLLGNGQSILLRYSGTASPAGWYRRGGQ